MVLDFVRRSHLVDERIKNLKNKSVAIIGVGGTGNLVAQLLARAGIGKMLLIDYDAIEDTNLERQISYLPSEVGKSKLLTISEKLLDFTEIKAVEGKVTKETIGEFGLLDYDLVIDATDNVDARIVIDEYMAENKKTWLFTGAIKNQCSFYFVRADGPKLSKVFGGKQGLKCAQVGVTNYNVTFGASIASKLAVDYLVLDKMDEDMVRINLDTFDVKRLKIN